MAGAITALVVSGCAAAPAGPTVVALPDYPDHGQAVHTVQAPRRDTLLPADCDGLLPAASVPALFALPEGSISDHGVVGVASPTVGMLERLSCTYDRAGDRGGPVLQLRAQAYTDISSASGHFEVNAAAEQHGSNGSHRLAIGTAPAVWIEEPGQHVLLVRDGRETLTVQLRNALAPQEYSQDLAVDLAQRVLPNLVPPPPTPGPQPPPPHPSHVG
jgi:hypothetical protein